MTPQEPHPQQKEHCNFEQLCKDYEDYTDSPEDEFPCPDRECRHDTRPHTPAQPAQQRIDAAIKELEIIRARNDKRGDHESSPNFHDGVAYGCEKAIALLQDGAPK